jgi:hypothetical protein
MRLRALAFVVVASGNFMPSGARAEGDVQACVSAAEQSQQLRDAGKFRAARQKLLLCARDTCPNVVRGDCAKWLSEIDGLTPTIVVRAEDASGHDVLDVKVYFDGELVTSKLDGRGIPIDPGQHALRFESASGTKEEKVLIREGERGRSVAVSFGGEGKAGDDASKDQPRPAPATGGGGGGVPAIAWVLGGGGLLLIGGGAYFWASGRSARGDLENSCAPTHSCTQGQVDSSKNKLVLGDVLAGVGIVSAGVAVYLILTAKPAPSASVQVGRTPPPLDVKALPGGGYASYSLQF